MRALVTGAGGKVGLALVPELRKARHDTLPVTHAEVDVTRPGDLQRAIESFRPDWIFHLAAYTDVDGCELQPERAHLVNAEGTRNVAQAALKAGATVLAISTDYVFAGDATRPYREDDPTGPQSVYGASKLAGESFLREVSDRNVVVRTAWLFGNGGRGDFVEKILERARKGERLQVVDDQRGSPTWSRDLALALVRLVEVGPRGTYHCTNAGECSRLDQAVYALERAGLSVPVARIDSATLASPARRPAYSVMSNRRFEEATGHRMRPWQDAVDRFLRAGAAVHPPLKEGR